jgi:hypothetical protein
MPDPIGGFGFYSRSVVGGCMLRVLRAPGRDV